MRKRKVMTRKIMTTERNNSVEYAIIVVEKDIRVTIAKKENIIIIRKMRKQRRLLMGMKMIYYYVCLWRLNKKKEKKLG